LLQYFCASYIFNWYYILYEYYRTTIVELSSLKQVFDWNDTFTMERTYYVIMISLLILFMFMIFLIYNIYEYSVSLYTINGYHTRIHIESKSKYSFIYAFQQMFYHFYNIGYITLEAYIIHTTSQSCSWIFSTIRIITFLLTSYYVNIKLLKQEQVNGLIRSTPANLNIIKPSFCTKLKYMSIFILWDVISMILTLVVGNWCYDILLLLVMYIGWFVYYYWCKKQKPSPNVTTINIQPNHRNTEESKYDENDFA
jgi:hypothetical protein